MSLRLDNFMPASPINPLVVVGVCAAGKTTLAQHLAKQGIIARPVAQEHSQVRELYRRSGDLVVLLAASWDTVHRRRRLAWNPSFYEEEWHRLAKARQGAALILHTDWLTPQEVADSVTRWYDQQYGFALVWQRHPGLLGEEQAHIRAQCQAAG